LVRGLEEPERAPDDASEATGFDPALEGDDKGDGGDEDVTLEGDERPLCVDVASDAVCVLDVSKGTETFAGRAWVVVKKWG